MASQLPKKGVKKVVLICSRFDDGLRDTLWNSTNLKEAIAETKQKLITYADQAFTNYRNTKNLDIPSFAHTKKLIVEIYPHRFDGNSIPLTTKLAK